MKAGQVHMRAGRLAVIVAVALVGWAGAVSAGRVIAGTDSSCEDVGDTSPVSDEFPGRMSSLVGADIRTGAHDCFERVVIEFAGTGELPGYSVRYEPGPLTDSPSGRPVEVAGDAVLVVSFGAWMPDMEGTGYDGPTQIVPTNVESILELRQLENFEGQSQWAIGLDRERGFRVSTLTDPVRILVDVEADPAEGPAATAVPGPTAGATSAPPETTAAPTTPPTAPDPSDHPLVGAWVFVEEADPAAPPVVLAFHADGTSDQTNGHGTGYGSWRPTGPTSAMATIAVPIFELGERSIVSTYRAEIDVGEDGRSFSARYTVEMLGDGVPSGQFGPGTGTALRIDVEAPGAPVGSLEDLAALHTPDGSATTTTTT